MTRKVSHHHDQPPLKVQGVCGRMLSMSYRCSGCVVRWCSMPVAIFAIAVVAVVPLHSGCLWDFVSTAGYDWFWLMLADSGSSSLVAVVVVVLVTVFLMAMRWAPADCLIFLDAVSSCFLMFLHVSSCFWLWGLQMAVARRGAKSLHGWRHPLVEQAVPGGLWAAPPLLAEHDEDPNPLFSIDSFETHWTGLVTFVYIWNHLNIFLVFVDTLWRGESRRPDWLRSILWGVVKRCQEHERSSVGSVYFAGFTGLPRGWAWTRIADHACSTSCTLYYIRIYITYVSHRMLCAYTYYMKSTKGIILMSCHKNI